MEGNPAPNRKGKELPQACTAWSALTCCSKYQLKAHIQSVNIQLDTAASSSHCAVVQHPGLPPEAIDHDGNPSLVSLIQLARAARKFVLHTPCEETGHCFAQYEKLIVDNMMFMAAARFVIGDSTYDPDIKKFPLQAVVKLGHIGKTSFSVITTVNTMDGHAVITVVNQMVLIDPCSRRPKPLPETWRQHYSLHTASGQPLRVPLQDPPFDASSAPTPYTVTVAWSDTDHNDHTNFTSYIRYAVDAVHHAARKGQLCGHNLLQNMAEGVREVTVVYAGESTDGDVLHIQVWEREDAGIVCSVAKDGQALCQVTLSFRSLLASTQLHPANDHSF